MPMYCIHTTNGGTSLSMQISFPCTRYCLLLVLEIRFLCHSEIQLVFVERYSNCYALYLLVVFHSQNKLFENFYQSQVQRSDPDTSISGSNLVPNSPQHRPKLSILYKVLQVSGFKIGLVRGS
jgi:hypothetical protein